MANTLTLENGKYKVTYDNGKLSSTRNGEQWRDLTGDNLVYALMYECVDVQNQRDELIGELQNCADLLVNFFPDAPIDSCIGVAITKARAVIAKATGVKP